MGHFALMVAVVVVVLTIACVNVSHLLLARGALRKREFAVRHDSVHHEPGFSGNSWWRRSLAVGGTLCGVVLALWDWSPVPTIAACRRWYLRVTAGFVARSAGTRLCRPDFCAVTTVLCGLLPAWRTSGMARLGMVYAAVGTSTRRRPVGLVAQVAMSLVLLFISGSFVAALLRVQSTDPGFETSGRLYAYTFLPSPPFPPDAHQNVYARALDRLRALPGVRMAALASSLPLIPPESDCASLSVDSPIRVTSSAVDTTYFETLGIKRLAGGVCLPPPT